MREDTTAYAEKDGSGGSGEDGPKGVRAEVGRPLRRPLEESQR